MVMTKKRYQHSREAKGKEKESRDIDFGVRSGATRNPNFARESLTRKEKGKEKEVGKGQHGGDGGYGWYGDQKGGWAQKSKKGRFKDKSGMYSIDIEGEEGCWTQFYGCDQQSYAQNRMFTCVADPIDDSTGYMPAKKIPETTLETVVSKDWHNKHLQRRGSEFRFFSF